MFRQFVTWSIILTLAFTTVACTSLPSANAPSETTSPQASVSGSSASPQAPEPINLVNGKYPVQQATYDDIDGNYTLMLLNTPPGQPAVIETTNLQMARLTDEQLQSGDKSYLNVEQGQAVLYLTEDFKIEYVHNVTENQVNSQTGQQEVVVIRQEPSFWTPFAGALAGQAIGSLLFTPHYYFPPVYQSGRGLVGYGGYGRTYGQAVDRYQTRYQSPPSSVRNQTLRTSGQLRAPAAATRRANQRTNPTQTNRPTGSGFGNSNLQRSNSPRPRTSRPSGFGTGSSRPRIRSGGRRR